MGIMSDKKGKNEKKDEGDWRDEVNWAEVLDNSDVPLWILCPELYAGAVILVVFVIVLIVSLL